MTGSWLRFSSAMGTVAAIAIIGLSGPLRAEDEVAMGSDSWRFKLTPYVWFTGLKGDVATFPRLPPVSVDAGFGDIIDNANFALMLAAEARRGRFGIITDLDYLALTVDGATPGPLFGGAEVDSTTLFATIAGFYQVLAHERVRLDALVGTRIWYVDTEINFNASLLPGRSVQDNQVWADPIIGVRFDAELGRGFSSAAAGDVGGFGLSSKLTWQLLGTLDYRFSDWFSVRAGYRYLAVDYEKDGFVWDVDLSGPIVGATFRF